ncbi:hypothetical protein VTO42DRAFT_433 [Malbranchea cinnamomea]
MGTPLLRQLGAVIDNYGQGPILRFPEHGIEVLPQALLPVVKVNEISAAAFKMWLPEHYHQFLDLFDLKCAETLPPL